MTKIPSNVEYTIAELAKEKCGFTEATVNWIRDEYDEERGWCCLYIRNSPGEDWRLIARRRSAKALFNDFNILHPTPSVDDRQHQAI